MGRIVAAKKSSRFGALLATLQLGIGVKGGAQLIDHSLCGVVALLRSQKCIQHDLPGCGLQRHNAMVPRLNPLLSRSIWTEYPDPFRQRSTPVRPHSRDAPSGRRPKDAL